MDYLINEGYPKAAEKFATEANLSSWPGDSENLDTRVQIRNAILSGNIQTAIDLIKSSFPRVSSSFSFSRSTQVRIPLAMIKLVSCTTHIRFSGGADDHRNFGPQNEQIFQMTSSNKTPLG